jgi:hypothetical protein
MASMPKFGQPAGTGPVKLPPVNPPKASAKGQFGLPHKKKRKVPAKGGQAPHRAPPATNMPKTVDDYS